MLRRVFQKCEQLLHRVLLREREFPRPIGHDGRGSAVALYAHGAASRSEVEPHSFTDVRGTSRNALLR